MSAIRHDWQTGEIEALFEKPFNDLLFEAQQVHRAHFDPNQVQVGKQKKSKDLKVSLNSGTKNQG